MISFLTVGDCSPYLASSEALEEEEVCVCLSTSVKKGFGWHWFNDHIRAFITVKNKLDILSALTYSPIPSDSLNSLPHLWQDTCFMLAMVACTTDLLHFRLSYLHWRWYSAHHLEV